MALKLGGNNPGQRLNATTATKTNGSQRFHFSFTVLKISPAGKNYKNRCSRIMGRLRPPYRFCGVAFAKSRKIPG